MEVRANMTRFERVTCVRDETQALRARVRAKIDLYTMNSERVAVQGNPIDIEEIFFPLFNPTPRARPRQCSEQEARIRSQTRLYTSEWRPNDL